MPSAGTVTLVTAGEAVSTKTLTVDGKWPARLRLASLPPASRMVLVPSVTPPISIPSASASPACTV